MTEQRNKDKAAFAGEKQPSMKRRSDVNNYHGRHIYLLTLAVEGRRPLLGKVVGNPLAADGSADAPRIELSALGGAVFDCWQQIPKRHPEVEILALQIMPDHLHGILWVKEEVQQHLGHIIGGFKTGCNKAYRVFAAALPQPTPSKGYTPGEQPSSELEPASSQVGSPCSAYAAALPQQSVQSQPRPKRERCEDRHHGLLFEPNYNDLICKSYDMLPTLINYVKDNPRRLLMKRAHSEYLRPFFNLRLGSNTYSGIGNLALLSAPHRLAVRVSRRNTEAQLQDELRRYMAAARSGTVLISPAISPGEKRVMRTAFDAKLPTVVIMENGFTPFSKPHGEQFYACAEGRLLMLSPWPHHNDRQKLTAQQCQAMNLMALELAALGN
ncbi:MAG: hypothetical protein IKO12_08940 [Bacteroidaceae bacterium]|nr:hypothetical protein [Bacteroidaceae bacterium]